MAYTDAMTDDARLTLAVAATGFAYGGLVLTRAEVVEGVRDAKGRIAGAVVRDLENGATYRLRAGLVVNAAGVWVDRIRERFGLEGGRLRPSRGSHIVLPKARLPIKAALTIPSPDDGRPIFLIPHEEGVLVGTTDIYHDGSFSDPRVTPAELDYMLRALRVQFPGRELTRRDVVAAFAGLRPILDAHTDNPSEASREEEVWEEEGLLSVAGGKLTTWRPMAEEAVDEALNFLPEERADRVGSCLTAGTPLAGLAPLDLAARLESSADLEPGIAPALARRLRGAAWWAPRLARDPAELQPLVEGSDLSAAEVRVHLTQGAVVRLEDLLLRRARLGLWQPDLARAVAPRLRPLFEQELGWNGARWEHESTALEAALEGWSADAVGSVSETGPS